MPVRSYLYVPGDRPERFSKAMGSGADAVIFDLEDAVPLNAKGGARDAVIDFLSAPTETSVEAWVRINPGQLGIDELGALHGSTGLAGIFAPKFTTAWLEEASGALGDLRLVALVESAHAVLNMAAIAKCEQVSQLSLGEVDLAADLAMVPSLDGRELWPIRLSAVVASAAHGCGPPIGPVWLDLQDLDGLRSSTEELRRAGFGARQAIHPGQIEVINQAMSPTPTELDRAERLLEMADEAGGGACVDDQGRMIDEAVLRSARRLLGR